MSYDNAERHSDDECAAELDAMFPDGAAGGDVLRELAPDGWEKSPLLAVFHPSVEQVYDEAVRMHRNVESLLRARAKEPRPEPTLEEIRAERVEHPMEVERECRELVGQCLWDIFSDNHDVRGPDGRLVDIGSFRGAGGFIADWINGRYGSSYDYMSFYMGSIWISQRADLSPAYRMIFRRMRARGLDWTYSFPKLHLVDLRPLSEAMRRETQDNLTYDPSSAFAREQEEQKKTAEVARMREGLEEAHRKAVEEARHGPPPCTVQAYRDVYGHLPEGWPPE